MKKYKYPEDIRCSDFEWVDYWYKDSNCDLLHIKRQVQSIIQNEMQLSSDDIDEYMDLIGRLVSDKKEELDTLLNIANQIVSKFEEVT